MGKGIVRFCLAGLLAALLALMKGTTGLADVGRQATSLTLGATEIGEGRDFATLEIGMPWDMSAQPYPDFATVFENVDRASFLANGETWSFKATSADPNLWLLAPGIASTQQVLRMGDRYPIDASVYSLVSFRLCSDVSDAAFVYWFLDQAPHSQYAAAGPVSVTAGCGLYVIDMRQITPVDVHGGVTAWGGLVRGLRLDPVNITSGANLQLDWIRVTRADISTVVPIQWSGAPPGSTIDFYLAPSCDPTEAMQIGQRPWSSSGTFAWGAALEYASDPAYPYPLPESFQPGSYTVMMRVDGTGPPTCSTSNLAIHPMPIVEITKPGPLAGEDYATAQAGDPWGMDDSGDISAMVNVASAALNKGVLELTNANGDPQLLLNTPVPIDTSRYYYLTFRMYLEGTQDIGNGWVHRWVWWYSGPTQDAVTTDDMIIYEGWHTYTIDLRQALIDPSSSGAWTGAPTTLRMDPHEVPVPMRFYLDYVRLWRDDAVTQGTPYPIRYVVARAQAPVLTFYYDDDKDLTNGRTPMASYTPPTPVGSERAYLPLVRRQYAPQEIEPPTGQVWLWDTSGVPPGLYFVSVDVVDGPNAATWYSEFPVEIIP